MSRPSACDAGGLTSSPQRTKKDSASDVPAKAPSTGESAQQGRQHARETLAELGGVRLEGQTAVWRSSVSRSIVISRRTLS